MFSPAFLLVLGVNLTLVALLYAAQDGRYRQLEEFNARLNELERQFRAIPVQP